MSEFFTLPLPSSRAPLSPNQLTFLESQTAPDARSPRLPVGILYTSVSRQAPLTVRRQANCGLARSMLGIPRGAGAPFYALVIEGTSDPWSTLGNPSGSCGPRWGWQVP